MENHIRAAQSVATQTTGLDGSTSEPNQLLDAALKYAAVGWAVIPLHTPNNGACSCKNQNCSSPGKHPRTRRGLDDATTDPKRVRQFWKTWPEANIGIVTGSQSGLLVLDVDDKGNQKGSDSLAALTAVNPEPLSTFTVRTGNGKHLYFKHPGYAIKNSVGAIGVGLDVRSERGYVVASPSRHANGSKYQIEAERPLAEVPDWLLAEMMQEKATAKKPIENEHGPFIDAPVVLEGQRNETLFVAAHQKTRFFDHTPV
jgi:Bifunctional DNA primase/polymerase, N-terminal